MPRRFALPLFILLAVFLSSAQIGLAATIPFAVEQAVVWVHCGTRQGSGVVINGEQGYVLTNAHVLLDLKTQQPGDCEVGFIDDETRDPSIYYEATHEKFIFESSQNQDFAILKIGRPLQAQRFSVFPFLKTDEFSQVGDPISIIGFPNTAKGKQSTTSGIIEGLEQGIIKTDAIIAPGASGGAGIDAEQNLTGIATRILLFERSPGVEEVIDYELVDIRAILNWLDTFGEDAHDLYVTHADPDRYHKVSTFLQPSTLSCTFLAKSPLTPTVYCLTHAHTRLVFPNDETYYSWFADFSAVETVSLEQLSEYRLTQNITMKPGSLIKITTDPKVYLVADIFGTLRWIETEDKAKELYGDGWAGFVKDVPDTFFTNYHLGSPIN